MVLVVEVLLYTARSNIKPTHLADVDHYQPWEEEVVKIARGIAVQDGGRVKPLEKWASVKMLAFHGDRSMKILVNGEKVTINPTEWMLTVVFRPDIADDLPIFRIDNSDILTQIGMPAKDRRDRYSFNEIAPHFKKLDTQVKKILKKKKADLKLTSKEKSLDALRANLGGYVALKNLYYAGKEAPDPAGDMLSRSTILPKKMLTDEPVTEEEKRTWMLAAYLMLNEKLKSLTENATLLERAATSDLAWIPPRDAKEKAWTPFAKRFDEVRLVQTKILETVVPYIYPIVAPGGQPSTDNTEERYRAMKAAIDQCVEQWPVIDPSIAEDKNEFLKLHLAVDSEDGLTQIQAFTAFRDKNSARMIERGLDEGEDIESSLLLEKMNYILNAVVFLLTAFVFITVYCVSPTGRWGKIGYKVALVCTVIGVILIIAGVTHRSIIMGRAPIATLYDTMPFIAGMAILILLLLEYISRRGIMLGVAIVLGLLGLFLARSYEFGEAKDQMDPIRAVLDSNYWLTIHVITIVIGYVGGLVAAGVSHVYIIGRMFGVFEDSKTLRFLTRSSYGLIAFTLIFSLIGTILGGIWAADSWGRFWGWDPKENGALLIVIWCLVVLHARAGGYIKQLGLHICAVFGAAVVAFSWWHVNSLSTGLHSYGFINGIEAVKAFYGINFAICIMGGIAAIVDRANRNIPSSCPPPTDPPSPDAPSSQPPA